MQMSKYKLILGMADGRHFGIQGHSNWVMEIPESIV